MDFQGVSARPARRWRASRRERRKKEEEEAERGGLGLHRDQDAMHTRCIEGPDHEESSVHRDGPPMQCRYESCIHGSPSFPLRALSLEPVQPYLLPARGTLRHVCCVLRHIILMNTGCPARIAFLPNVLFVKKKVSRRHLYL